MNKSGHPKIVILLLLAMPAAGALGYWLFSQLRTADPAASVRKQYAATRVAPSSGITTPASSLGKLRSGLSQVTVTPTPLQFPSAQVQTSPEGNILSVVPPDIAEIESSKPSDERPVVQVPGETPKQSTHSPLPSATTPFLAASPVPQRLLDQTPPELTNLINSSPTPAQIRVAPRRYLFNNLSPEAIQGKTVQVRPEEQRDVNPQTFSPMGEDITLALMNNVASNSFEVPVAAGVWQPFYFQGHLLLRVGDKIIGTAHAGKNRNRILVTFTKVILTDGRSIPIQATALDMDGTVGVRGFVVGENLLKTLTPVLLSAVQEFAEVFQNQTVTSSSSIIGTTTQTTLGNDLGTKKGVEAGRGALDKISEIISTDLEENRPYVLAIAGTTCRARLLQPMDVSLADYEK